MQFVEICDIISILKAAICAGKGYVMAGFEPKKMAPVRILQILQKHSDADHPLTQKKIAEYLKEEYGIVMERKAIGNHITELTDAGFDIGSCRGGSYMKSREFLDSELRMLIDGVLQSKHITAKHSKDLIERLCALSSKYFRSHIKNVYSVNDWSKTENQALFYNIEMIDEAIATGKQIQYDYNKYGADKKLHKTRTHRASPYQLILHNQRYYLMAQPSWGNITFQRLDRISNMRILDEPILPISQLRGWENGIDYKKIATSMPYMYAGEPERVVFVADVGIVDQIIDWFGKDIAIQPLAEDEKKVSVSLMASPTAMKYWAMQYADHVVVTKPDHLRDEIKASFEKALKKY